MSKQAFEKKVAALSAIRDGPPNPEAILQVRKGLEDKNNFLASKAAAVAGHWREESLLAALEEAFYRFLEDGVKRDPQCWAKIAIVKALKAMDHRVATIYLSGIQHFQLEPVWGGSADTAGPLRSACALALPACHMSDLETLQHLSALLADPEKTVRADAATAIAQLGVPAGGLVLRLKALLPEPDPEVLGQVLSSLLQLEEQAAVPFVLSMLYKGAEDARLEAIAALAPSPHPEALEGLLHLWQTPISPDCRRTLVQSLAASPNPKSTAFLLSVIDGPNGDLAAHAVASIAASRFRGEARLHAAFRQKSSIESSS